MRYLNINKAIDAWNGIQPISERDRERLSRKFTVDFNFNSNHIEGNTLTYGQTELLLLFGKVVGEAQMKDLEEMKASNVGLKMMQEQAGLKDMPLTQNFIRQLHKTLIREDYTVHTKMPGGQQGGYVIHAGQYKTRPNSVITRYGDRFEYASPEETPALMADLVNWYNAEEQSRKLSAIELAALFHYRYIRIHPFEDGNGRIARLMVNYILSRHDYPMIVVRSRDKQNYLEALHQSDLEVGSAPSLGAHAPLMVVRWTESGIPHAELCEDSPCNADHTFRHHRIAQRTHWHQQVRSTAAPWQPQRERIYRSKRQRRRMESAYYSVRMNFRFL